MSIRPKRTQRATDDALVHSPYLGERRDSRLARMTIWTILCGLVFFVAWAAGAPVYEVVSGQGVIEPAGLTRKIEHLEGGIVVELRAGEGAHVDQGDVLAVLDTTQLLAERQKLTTEIARRETGVARYRDLVETDLSRTSRDELAAMLDSADPSFAQEVAYRLAQIETLRNERAIAIDRRSSILKQRDKLAEELTILSAQDARFETEAGKRSMALLQIESTQREILRREGDLLDLESEAAQQAAEARRRETLEAEIVADYRREAAARLEEQSAARAEATESLSQIEDRIRHSVVRAPVSGRIKSLGVTSVGEVLGAGETVAEIVPDGASVFAEIEVSADRIGGVAIDQEARLKILANDFTRYGEVAARVERISPSSFAKENGQQVFRVKLSVPTTEMVPRGGAGGASREIRPGMTVSADIRASRRTVLEYLLKPLRVISTKALSEA